jgi:hypothetical protein
MLTLREARVSIAKLNFFRDFAYCVRHALYEDLMQDCLVDPQGRCG